MQPFRSAIVFAALACALVAGPVAAQSAPPVSTSATSTSCSPDARRVPLQGGRNMRSLDRLPVRGGVLRPGALYRSARLTHLSTADVERVNGLKLVTLVDVRMGLEAMFQGPDSEEIKGRRLFLPMHAPISPSSSFYLKILNNKNGRKSIARFFATLSDSAAYPLLYHCGIGKDRTGTLTALLLELLGTPRDVIVDDYLASGKTAKREWLQSVFDEVDKAGGIETYLQTMGVTHEQMDGVRRNLVVPSPN